MASAFLGQPHQLLRSAPLDCYANGLTGTVAADEPSQQRTTVNNNVGVRSRSLALPPIINNVCAGPIVTSIVMFLHGDTLKIGTKTVRDHLPISSFAADMSASDQAR